VRNVLVLADKEFKGLMRMPLGYVVLSVYALVSGMVLMTMINIFDHQLARVTQQASQVTSTKVIIDVQVVVVTPYLLNVAALLIFIIPFITMRVFAEEKRSRSLEILVSYPLRVWEIVAGKFLGIFGFFGLMLSISAVHLVILQFISAPHWGPIIGGFGGLILLGMTLIVIGLFVSSLTQGQVEAAVLTLGLFMIMVMAGEVAGGRSSLVQRGLSLISPLYHFQDFGRGVLAVQNLCYFISASLLFFALTMRGVDLLKWRG